MDNKSISIRNFGSDSITLVGLQNGVNGYADISTAYENISRSSFTIAICHTPDTAKDVPTDLTKYFLAGHSLGGQVYYGLGSLYTPLKADYYFKGKHIVNDSVTLDITSGTGESIGQVASQTLESMNCINRVVSMPVIRPLVCMDKTEIIDLARKIGTYETSIQPFEDCCTIFDPKNPVTKPTTKKAEFYESCFD